MFASHIKAIICFIILTSLTILTPSHAAEYREIEWVELMPAEDLDALLNPPEIIGQIADGSAEDSVAGLSGVEDEATQRYLAALESTTVIQSFNDTKIKLPGFIVPIEMKDESTVVEFLLVPFFGACLHLPPPPPNQIVYVSYPKGVELSSYQDAFWLEGTIKVETIENEMGVAAYVLEVDNIYPYSE